VTRKCETCVGRKLVNETKTLTVNIEPGSKDEETIVLKSQGDEWQGKSTGDVIFVIKQNPHTTFERM